MKKLVLGVVLGLVCTEFLSCSKTTELDFDAQLKKDVAEIDAYLSTNHITAVKDSSGVRYVIDSAGTGIKPTLAGKVSVKYSASILNSTSIFSQSSGAVLTVNLLIAGWQIVLPKIPKGSKFTLFIPSGLAYGSDGGGVVPSNANVVFNVELLDDDAQLIADIATIDAYLDSIGPLDVHTDASGIRYVYSGNPGTGNVPLLTGFVTVTYAGKLLDSLQTVFDNEASPLQFALSDVIQGWQIGLTQIPAGSQFTLYIPSGLAYGPVIKSTTSGSIPANSNLIFDIHLISAP